MQSELLEVLQEDAALRLDDGLGQAGGAGGVEHPQRVAEGHLLEDGGSSESAAAEVSAGPLQRALGGGRAQQRDVNDGAEAGQFAAEFGDGLAAVVFLAAVAVSVDGEQHGGLDLLEAVQDAAGAEVGRARGPYGADGGGGEQGDGGLGDVGEIAADAVARPYTEAAQLGGEGAHLAAQLRPGDGARFVLLVHVQDRGVVGSRGVLGGTQRVLGVVEGRPGEPGGARHRGVGEHGLVRGGEADLEPFGERLPEGGSTRRTDHRCSAA